jgi:HK97 family phage major capsid protein
MIKKDDKKLEEISKKTAMNVTTDSQGGYTVPTILEAGVWSIAEQYGLSLQKATVIPMRSATHDLTTDATDVTVKKISEGNSIDPSEPTFGRKQLQAIDYVGALAVSSLQLLEDSNVNVANYVIEKFGKAFGLYMDKNAFKGDDYEGVLTASGTTAYVMGSTNYLTLTPDDLSAMIDSLSSGELTNAEFYFDKKIAGILRTLKDSAGNYIYQPATAKDPAMVFGYPVNFVGDAVLPSAPSSNTKFGFLGNMKHFAIGRREGLRIDVSDSYKFNTAQMTWRALQRFDMKAIIPGAFVTIATKA